MDIDSTPVDLAHVRIYRDKEVKNWQLRHCTVGQLCNVMPYWFVPFRISEFPFYVRRSFVAECATPPYLVTYYSTSSSCDNTACERMDELEQSFERSDRIQEHLYKVLVIGDFGVGMLERSYKPRINNF